MTLKELRLAKGFKNQREFASAIGKKNTTVSMWEKRKSAPRLKDISIMAEKLGVTEADILECFK